MSAILQIKNRTYNPLTMQIGQTIWAIDPCEMTFTKKEALIVGKAYEVKVLGNDYFKIESELHPMHVFYLLEFDTFFSLTPPEGKGGELPTDEQIEQALRNGLGLADKTIDEGAKQLWIDGAKWMRDYVINKFNL